MTNPSQTRLTTALAAAFALTTALTALTALTAFAAPPKAKITPQ